MRKVTKSYRNPPGDLGPTVKHNSRLIKIYCGTGACDNTKISPKVYGKTSIRNKLKNLYHSKCAYCERKDYEFEIEHYRPKKSVEGEVHTGYFWLSYEWSNLLPACHDCNKRKSKSTKFPIEGTRVSSPVIKSGQYAFQDHHFLSRRLKREYPLLIHPEEPEFDPCQYFKFDKTGWMIPAASKTTRKFRRANATINSIVRLNRDNLYLVERKNMLDIYQKRLIGIYYRFFYNFQKDGINSAEDNLQNDFFTIMKEIEDRSKPTKEYSFFWSFVLKNFYMFLPQRLKKRPKDRTRFKSLIEEYHSI